MFLSCFLLDGLKRSVPSGLRPSSWVHLPFRGPGTVQSVQPFSVETAAGGVSSNDYTADLAATAKPSGRGHFSSRMPRNWVRPWIWISPFNGFDIWNIANLAIHFWTCSTFVSSGFTFSGNYGWIEAHNLSAMTCSQGSKSLWIQCEPRANPAQTVHALVVTASPKPGWFYHF